MVKKTPENMNSYERKVLEEETREKLVLIHREKLLQVKVVTVLEEKLLCAAHKNIRYPSRHLSLSYM